MLWELCREQGSGIHGPGGEWPQLQRVAMQILLLSPCFIVSLGENALCFVSLEARIYILFSFFFFLEGVDVSYKEMYAIKMEITGM